MNTCHTLQPGCVFRLAGNKYRHFHCLSGYIWLSLAGQDLLLGAGEHWQQLPATGEPLLIEAVGGSARLVWYENVEHSLVGCSAWLRLRSWLRLST